MMHIQQYLIISIGKKKMSISGCFKKGSMHICYSSRAVSLGRELINGHRLNEDIGAYKLQPGNKGFVMSVTFPAIRSFRASQLAMPAWAPWRPMPSAAPLMGHDPAMFAGGSNGLQMHRVFPLTLSKIIRFS